MLEVDLEMLARRTIRYAIHVDIGGRRGLLHLSLVNNLQILISGSL